MEGALQKEDNHDSKLLDDLILPIEDEGAGGDPRYGDDFNRVKQEIDRLSNTDYLEVIKRCQKILKRESKDLRVAGYLLLAKVYTEGLSGLLEGVQLYYELVHRYGVECHPQREIARQQAIAWLNGGKLVAFVNKIEFSSAQERLEVFGLKALIDSLNNEITSLYGDDATTWTSLNPWIHKNLPVETTVQKREIKQTADSTPDINQGLKSITSELIISRAAEELLSYLSQQKEWIRHIALSRALRWSGMVLPVNENGITKITPPRSQVVTELQSPFDAQQIDGKLQDLEAYFMESGCQFYFDLQKRQADIAAALGNQDVAIFIESSLRHLLNRVPQLLSLSYSDGTPFASEQTRRWINKTKSEKQTATVAHRETDALSVKIEEILERADTKDLVFSISKLDSINVEDRCDQFHIDLAKIDLCIAAGRNNLALPLAEHLEHLIEKYRLHEWQRSLALALWKRLLVILQCDQVNTTEKDHRINQLKGKICTMDLGFAVEAFQFQ